MSPRPCRAVAAFAVAAGLVAGAAAPAAAVPPDPASPAVREADRLLLPAQRGAAGDALETARTSRPVAPGVTLTSFDRLDAKGWLRGDLLTVDLTVARAGYLSPGAVASVEPLSAQAARAGAVAAVNGDFFDINRTGAPNGPAVDDGRLVKSAKPGWSTATAGVGADGLGRIADVLLDGEITLPGGRTVPLDRLNSPTVEEDGIAAFTSLWGTAGRGRSLDTAARRVTEVVVNGGEVASVTDAPGSGAIPADGFVLLGREKGGDLLRTLNPGDRVTLAYRARPVTGGKGFAVGGNAVLLRDGRPLPLTDPAAHPRTAAGFSADGRRMLLMTVDGRQVDSRGVTLAELAALMREAGAHDAINLDGGGSSTLLAREPGQERGQLENSPSDGAERPTPNGVGLFARGSGRLTGFRVEPLADPTRTPGTGPTGGGRPDRAFPGLARTLVARGHDEAYGPAPGEPRWTVSGPHGTVDRDGVFRGRSPGTVTVSAVRGKARGRIDLTVLGPLTRIGTTADRITLPGPDTTAVFGVVGFDRDGYTAPIEPTDTRLDYDTSLLDIQPDGDGTVFTVTPRAASGSTLVTVEVRGHRTVLPVGIGLQSRTIAGLDDADRWRFGSARGSGLVAPVAEGRTGPGLRLAYDFTRSTATRTAHAHPPRPIEVPGRPVALGAWVYGHGRGEWTAFTITDAGGQAHSLYGPHIDWKGWRYVEMKVPASAASPIRVDRFSTIETRADRRYTGEILLDDLVARVPPPPPAPPPSGVPADPMVIRDGTARTSRWRFAVMSGARLTAADPGGTAARRARRTLREVLAARPDLLIINGDLVGTGTPEDFAFARRLLDEELRGRLPYHYVPGDHEIHGSGTIDAFTRAFGRPSRTFDHKGTRFVLLDSSTGTYRTSSFEQLRMLRRALDGARRDPSVRSVVVVGHHPSRDPLPAGDHRLADRKEAALLEGWLAEFRARTGKGAAVVNAHAGVFGAFRVDGVPAFVNGDAGTARGESPSGGGFTGWTMVGVDPPDGRTARPPGAAPRQWLRAEVRPHVDGLTVAAPRRVHPGRTVTITATLRQHGREVPLAYPMSADWSGSPNVRIGGDPRRAAADPGRIAAFDPATGRLEAFGPGTVTLAVEVNGVTRRTTITIA